MTSPGPTWRARPGLVALPLALAVAALGSVSLAIYGAASLAPKSPPFVLARLLADGPAKAYLAEACPARAYAICPYAQSLPASEIAIVWGFFHERRRTDEYARMRAEQGEIVLGTLRRFPGRVIGNALSATAWQLVTIKSEAQFDDKDRWKLPARYPYAAEGFAASRQGRGALTLDDLAPFNRLHGWVAVLSALAAVALSIVAARRGRVVPAWLLAAVAVALLANAFTTGALSGVYGRYQGRAIWLLTLCAIVAWRAQGDRWNASRPPTRVARTRPSSSRPA